MIRGRHKALGGVDRSAHLAAGVGGVCRKSHDAGFDAHLVKSVEYAGLMKLMSAPTA